MIKTSKGSCLCNQVQFEIDLPTKWVSHCHCSLCRKAHGAGYVTWLGVEDNHFRLLSDAALIQWYQSSSPAKRGFCKNCGSTLFFKSAKWPRETHIVLANMNMPIDKAPAANVNFSSHVDWMPIDKTIVTKN
jgi:hypothetical protein